MLYTRGVLVEMTAAQFAAYSEIQVSSGDRTSAVELGFTVSGTLDLSSRLGNRAVSFTGASGNDRVTLGGGNDTCAGDAGNDTFVGGNGNDLLIGDWNDGTAIGQDDLYGGSGSDTLVGGLDNDRLFGGDGDDYFLISESAAGNDMFYGGSGVDVVAVVDVFGWDYYEYRLNRLVLNSASQVEVLFLDDTTLVGTSGSDRFDLSGVEAWTGNVRGVRINLGSGADTFIGGVSDETIVVSGGGDDIALGAGNDELWLSGGIVAGNILSGGQGTDILVFAGAATLARGALQMNGFVLTAAMSFEGLRAETLPDGQLATVFGNQRDNLFDLRIRADAVNPLNRLSFDLGGGNDRFLGGLYAESVRGGDGQDTLSGGAGNDTIDGGTGDDSMSGGAGFDVYVVDSMGDIVIEDGPARDRDTVQTSLAAFTLSAEIENLTAIGSGGLVGTGHSGRNALTGAAGNDYLKGLGGNDTLEGGDGVDTLVGGNGDDDYFVSDSSDVILETATGGTNDSVYSTAASYTLAAHIENLFIARGDGGEGRGNAGNNSLSGGAGDDTLWGMDGDDRLSAGGSGIDMLIGGAGNDIYSDLRPETILLEEAGEGVDSIETTARNFTLAENFENLMFRATPGNSQRFVGYGNAADNLISSEASNSTLSGGEGNDTLSCRGTGVLNGGIGDDLLFGTDGSTLAGGAGDDTYVVDTGGSESFWIAILDTAGFDTIRVRGDFAVRNNVERLIVEGAASRILGNYQDNIIIGAGGDDTIRGLQGDDTLTGNGGADRFECMYPRDIFYPDSFTRITDFAPGTDVIGLYRAGFTGIAATGGPLAPDLFKDLSRGAIDSTDRIIYDPTTGNLYFDAVAGAGQDLQLFLNLQNRPNLTAADFDVFI